ncbi:MAG: hypothetical protein E6I74_01530, partial [Chloroflexi bacterium]
MQALDAILSATSEADPWPARRQRAEELASRYPHAADILRLYRAYADNLPPPLAGEGQGGGMIFPSPLVAPSVPSP